MGLAQTPSPAEVQELRLAAHEGGGRLHQPAACTHSACPHCWVAGLGEALLELGPQTPLLAQIPVLVWV